MSVNELLSEIERKDEQIKELENTNSKAQQSIQKFFSQQKSLFDEFVILREKYDKNKLSLLDVLYNHCVPYHPDLKRIPSISYLFETDEKIGNWSIHTVLGEGQFAIVKSGLGFYLNENNERFEVDDCAIKIINKEKLSTIQTLKRLSTEIDILWHLHRSKYIIDIFEVIHTSSKLYIITERGPSDLFEFFNKYSNGISEESARSIIIEIFNAIFYCHQRGICHRDLKPENLLLSYDENTKKVKSLKLCDFGLATYCDSSTSVFTEFCGSPGFFDCEMLIRGSYNGFSADIWSVGCIILNMLLGHKQFENVWMRAYDYELLKSSKLYEVEINKCQSSLLQYLPYTEDLNDLLPNLLAIDSSKRINRIDIIKHSWFDGSQLAVNEDNKLPIMTTSSRTSSILLQENSEKYYNIEPPNNKAAIAVADNSSASSRLPSIKSAPKTPNCQDARKFLHDEFDNEFIELPNIRN